jgi:hypothetical protein
MEKSLFQSWLKKQFRHILVLKTKTKKGVIKDELDIRQIISKPFRWLFIAALLVLIIYRFFENIFK